jgi:hypothetical protein
MRWMGFEGREWIDMGKESGKEESRERHLKGRGQVSLVPSGRVW